MKSFFQKLFSKKENAGKNRGTFKGHQQGFVHHAYRDWQIVLVVFGILAIASVFWGLSFFQQVNSGEAFLSGEHAVVPAQSSTLLNQTNLNALISQFNAEAAEYSAELGGGESVADPSR